MPRKTYFPKRGVPTSRVYRPSPGKNISAMIPADFEGAPMMMPFGSFSQYYPLGGEPLIDPLNSDSEEMNVDGSVTPVEFSVTPPAGFVYCVTSFNIMVVDNATPPDRFGNIASGLTNGIPLEAKVGPVTVMSLTRTRPIKTNADLVSRNPEGKILKNTLGSSSIIMLSFRPPMNIGRPLNLDSRLGVRLAATIRDDCTGLEYLRMSISGWAEPSVA